MKQRVQMLLNPPANLRKTLTVTIGEEELEIVDKLALFFGEKSGQKYSRNQVIEQAIKGLIDESAELIQEQYHVDIRMIPIAELTRDSYDQTVDVTALDTVIVPARDNNAYREAFFQQRSWPNVRIQEEKLRCMQYFAVYVGSPTSGITHYSRIQSYFPDPAHTGRFVIVLMGDPIPLPAIVTAGDSAAASGMRSCRYTSLNLLQQAQTLGDLFPQHGL